LNLPKGLSKERGEGRFFLSDAVGPAGKNGGGRFLRAR